MCYLFGINKILSYFFCAYFMIFFSFFGLLCFHSIGHNFTLYSLLFVYSVLRLSKWLVIYTQIYQLWTFYFSHFSSHVMLEMMNTLRNHTHPLCVSLCLRPLSLCALSALHQVISSLAIAMATKRCACLTTIHYV